MSVDTHDLIPLFEGFKKEMLYAIGKLAERVTDLEKGTSLQTFLKPEVMLLVLGMACTGVLYISTRESKALASDVLREYTRDRHVAEMQMEGRVSAIETKLNLIVRTP
jgi:hypothetical protein